jgi:DNA-binding FadR family transcriptional regulator
LSKVDPYFTTFTEVLMKNEQERFEDMVQRDTALKELVGYIEKNYRTGEKLPSEREMSDLIIGYSRQKLREALIRLECFGYINIQHGKSSVLLKDF